MVLSILLKKGETVTPKGSGFVTNKKGLGITAGHVLIDYQNEIENIRVAFPNLGNPSQLFKIKLLYIEHFDPITATGEDIRKRRLPFYQDLAIFRIVSFKYKDFYRIKSERPLDQELLTVNGFFNPKQKKFQIENNFVDLSELAKENNSFQIKHRLFSIFSSKDSDHQMNPDLVELEKKYNNCLTLKNASYHGVSGGPILNSDKKVVGILLGGNQSLHYCNILCSRYIRRKYRFIR